MELRLWIMVLKILYYARFIRSNETWVFNTLIHKISNDLNNKQLIIILDNNVNINAEQQYFIKISKNEISTYLFTINNLKKYSVSLSTTLPALNTTRSTVLYVVFMDHVNETKVNEHLQLFKELSPIANRPKCLFIFFIDNLNTTTKLQLKNILFTGWALKFLDLTIIKIYLNEVTIFNYNPFKNEYTIEPFGIETNIFPNKLINLYQYPIKIIAYHLPPFVYLDRDDHGNVIKAYGILFSIFETVSNKMNFKLISVFITNYTRTRLYELLDKNNAITVLVFHTIPDNGNSFSLIGQFYELFPWKMIAPNIIRPHSRVPMHIILELFIMFLIIFAFWIIIFICKFQNFYISALDVFQILLSFPIKDVPKCFSKRFIFLSLVAFSMFYSTDVIANLTKLNVIVEDMTFNSAEDVYKYGFEIYTNLSILFDYIKIETKSYPDTLKPKVSYSSSIACLQKICDGQKVICIINDFEAKLYLNYYEQFNVMKDLKFHLKETLTSFYYEKGNPYIERFDQIMQKFVDHGLFKSWEFRQKYFSYFGSKQTKPYKSNDYHDQNILMLLITIIISGYIISCFIFIGERLYTCK